MNTLYTKLGVAEDIVIAERLAERIDADSGTRTTLAEAAEIFGIDLDAL